jgi:hypothetical protein
VGLSSQKEKWMNKYIKEALKKYPTLDITSDEETIRVVSNGLEKKGGMCPCFSAPTPCVCSSGKAVAEGKLDKCKCGLFVRRGTGINTGGETRIIQPLASMNQKTAIIWSQDNCIRCIKAKRRLLDLGWEVEERNVDVLMKGLDKDTDAMAQLCLQGKELPLIKLDGFMIDPEEYI